MHTYHMIRMVKTNSSNVVAKISCTGKTYETSMGKHRVVILNTKPIKLISLDMPRLLELCQEQNMQVL